MNWLRENWFDALLFVLLAAVVVAIVLFLVGVNPFAKPPAPAVVSSPPAPVAKPQTPASPTPTAQPAPTPRPGTAASEGGEVTVLPLPPVENAQGSAKPVARPSAQTPGPVPAPAKPAPAPSRPRARYRVSVGAFTRPEYAVDLARKMEEAGYPVRIEVIGRVSRVVVGPYGSRSRAEAVAAELRAYEPQVYKGDTPEPTGTYLQVAAFKDLKRARVLAKELKDRGYSVVVNYRDGWAKVWVGPVAPVNLTETKARLEKEGYRPVEVKGGQG